MLFAFLGFILGSILGSLSLALAERSLEDKTFLGRSNCPNCKHKLSTLDLVPVISYLTLGGKCRYCHKKIKIEYLFVEVLMGFAISIVFFISFQSFTPGLDQYRLVNFFYDLILKIFITTVLMIVAITDLKKTLIPDRITYPSVIIVFLSLASISAYRIWYLFTSLNSNQFGQFLIFKSDYFLRHAILTAAPLGGGLIMGIIIGLAFLLLIVITRGRGMGGGDLKFGILLGLYLGFPQGIASIMLAFFLGSILAVVLIVMGKKKLGQTIPFGPFLSLGGFITILFGKQITDWYLNLQIM